MIASVDGSKGSESIKGEMCEGKQNCLRRKFCRARYGSPNGLPNEVSSRSSDLPHVVELCHRAFVGEGHQFLRLAFREWILAGGQML